MYSSEPLVSIVIPVYKVEKYLERCVRSVVAQTYRNLEIILVDDGSPDNCGELCRRLAEQDPRISVYHKENGGLSDARNYGTRRSSGEYIAYIDSDDYVAPDYIEYLYDLIKSNEADASCCCMVRTENDTVDFHSNPQLPETQVLSGYETCEALLSDLDVMYMVLVTAWGKLYRSEIAKKHPFPFGKKHEDEATTCKFYHESSKVAVGNRCLYAYFQNPGGIMNSRGTDLNMDVLWALSHRAEYFAEKGETKLEQLSWDMMLSYLISDTVNNKGRCDRMLREFSAGKSLSQDAQRKLKLYNASPSLYKLYYRTKRSLSRVVRNKLHG